MRLVFKEDEKVASFVSDRIGHVISPPFVAIGMTADGKRYCGGAVFNNWNGSNIEITVAMDKPVSRGVIRALHHYVFVQSKATRVTAHTRRSNKKAQRVLPRLGFKFEGIAKRYFGPERQDDAICYVLLPEYSRLFYGNS